MRLAFGVGAGVFRAEPRWNGDQGVFLSIAARMLDGDRLYADVIDNKDPLFFYAHAGALWIGGWKGPAALDALWLGASGSLVHAPAARARRAGPAVVAGFLLYPLALTASWYEPGLTMLGGLALAPLVGWLWLRGNFAFAGAILAVVVLFKITVGLVAVAPVAALLLIGAPDGPRLRHVARAALGFAGTISVAVAFLAIRGELVRYVEVLPFNVRYPDAARRAQGGTGGLGSHLAVIREFFLQSGRWQWPVPIASLVRSLGASGSPGARAGPPFRGLRRRRRDVARGARDAGAHCNLVAPPADARARRRAHRGRGDLRDGARFGARPGVAVAALLVAFAFWGSSSTST